MSANADCAIALHGYADKDPTLFAKLATFGIARAQLLLGLHKSEVLSMLGNKHLVPSSGVRKSIAQMTFSELLDPAEALVGSYRRQRAS